MPGAIILSQDQLAFSANYLNAVPTEWSNLAASGDLANAGTLLNIVTTGITAYLTAHNNTDDSLSGLWHCEDLTSASPAWTLIKSGAQAETDTGYTGSFGAIDTRDDGAFCAVFHTSSGGRPSDNGPCAVLIGSGSVGSWYDLPTVGGIGLYVVSISSENLHCVWGGAGDFYIGCGSGGFVTRQPHVVHTLDGSAWTEIDFTSVTAATVQHIKAIDGGYCACGDAPKTWRNWNPLDEISGLQTNTQTGIHAEQSEYLYTTGDDLYQSNGAAAIGDASAEFGAGRIGSMAMFVPGSTEQIVWLCRNAALEANGHKVAVFTDDGGETWQDKTSDFYTNFGDWSGNGGTGPAGAPRGNAIVRLWGIPPGGQGGEDDPYFLTLPPRVYTLRLRK